MEVGVLPSFSHPSPYASSCASRAPYLAHRPARGQPSARKGLASLRNQFLVGEPHADALGSERVNASHRVGFAIALVQPERDLIDVALHVLDGEVMVDAVVTALQKRP